MFGTLANIIFIDIIYRYLAAFVAFLLLTEGSLLLTLGLLEASHEAAFLAWFL